MQGGLALYTLLLTIHYFAIAHSFLFGTFQLGFFFWYLGTLDESIKSRQKIESASQVLDAHAQELDAQGYHADAADIRVLLIKKPTREEQIWAGCFWVMGCVVAYGSRAEWLVCVAGCELALMGLVSLYTALQEDSLIG
jgi:hypothetical protein